MAEIFSFGGRGCFLYFAWKESLLYNEKISVTVLRKKSLLPCCVNGHKEQAGNL